MGSACSETDRRHLTSTLVLAELGRAGARPNPVVGALLAVGDEVLSSGHHDRYGGPHAERVALDAVDEVPAEATLYVSLEPCSHHGHQPPCADLLIERGVRRVVIASGDPSAKTSGIGPERLRRAGVEVLWGPADIEAAAMQQNAGFQSVHRRGRPYVTFKWAMTGTGRVATGDPERRWISGPESRRLVQHMRAASGAIAVGVGTVIADDPRLTVRGEPAAMISSPPLRVVYDRRLRTPEASVIVETARDVPTIVVCCSNADDARAAALEAAGVEVWPFDDEQSMLEASLRQLAARGVNDVLLESGPELASAMHEQGLIDRLVCFRADVEAATGQPGFEPGHPFVTALAGGVSTTSGSDTLTTVVLAPMARDVGTGPGA